MDVSVCICSGCEHEVLLLMDVILRVFALSVNETIQSSLRDNQLSAI